MASTPMVRTVSSGSAGGAHSGGVPADAQSDFQLMGEAWDTIHQDYVDRTALDAQQLTHVDIVSVRQTIRCR